MLSYYLILGGLIGFVSGYEKDMTFNVEAGRKDCFYHKVTPSQVIDIEYQVIDGSHGDLDISFQLSEPGGRIIVTDYKKSENSHRHEAQVDGDYRFCFDNSFSTFTTKTVFFDLMIDSDVQGIDQYDDEKEMELTDVPAHEVYSMRVRDISTAVGRVRELVARARRLQEALVAHGARDGHLAEHSRSMVDAWSIIQIGVMLAVGALQIVMVRSLFEETSKVRSVWKLLSEHCS